MISAQYKSLTAHANFFIVSRTIYSCWSNVIFTVRVLKFNRKHTIYFILKHILLWFNHYYTKNIIIEVNSIFKTILSWI